MARRDDITLPLPGVKRPAGRPRSGNAKTPAQRQAAYRDRQKAIPAAAHAQAWEAVCKAIRARNVSPTEARQIYFAWLRGSSNVSRECSTTPRKSYGASTTVTKSQK